VSQVSGTAGVNVERTFSTDYYRSTILAFILCGLLTLAGLLAPPSMSHDAGWGMLEWRTLVAGGPINSIIRPDPGDIARDQLRHVTWWSPGQYLVPGVLTLLGFRLGTALTITAGASLLCCLLGWIQVTKHFALGPRVATLAVVFIATFRYSTLPFGIYNGGEILLQGVTPWLILVGCRLPTMGVLRAAGLACFTVLLAFFVKLTGIMVASIAMLAGAVAALIRIRRITAGMLAGTVGATLAFGALYVGWFSHGTTPASGTTWSFRVGDLLFAFGAPWSATVSWLDMVTSLLFNPRHPLFHSSGENGDLSVILWFLLPPLVLFSSVTLKGWYQSASDRNLRTLLVITVCFYTLCSVAMSAIFLRGGDVSLEERHLRAAGMLILICALAVADRLPRNSASRTAVGTICVLMSVFGVLTFVYRARSTRQGEIDPYSRTHQTTADESALESMRAAFATEGRKALFVLPSPDAASAFPPSARILTNQIEFESETTIAERTYHGKVPGRIYVIMPTAIAGSTKGNLLLKEFVDYPVDAWEKQSFGRSTVFVQEGTPVRN
jgi:hypothetical protein